MEQYINKAALVAEIEDWRDKIKKGIFSIPLTGSDRAYATFEYEILGKVRDFLDTLETKEVDLEKEIETHLKDCLDIKFPTTDIELIKKDVAYTARKFFELGLKVKAEINKPVNDQGTTPLIIHVPPKFGQGTLSRPAYKNGCFYHQNFISDKEFLDRAIDYIIEVDGTDNICEKLHDIPEEHIFCERDCQNLDHWCVLRFLKHYKIKHLYESK